MAETQRGAFLDQVAARQGKAPGRWRKGLARFRRSRPAVVGSVIVGTFGVLALLAPIIAPVDPLVMHTGIRLTPPDGTFWLGTDEFGRDILSRLLFGARISFAASFGATSVAALFGITLGLVAGYFRGWVDRIASGAIDTVFSFPSVLLAVGLVAMLGPSLRNVIIAIAIVMMPHFARTVRATTLGIRNQQYVEAAQAVGASDLRVVLRHILPNIAAPIIVQASLVFSYSISAEATLSFLGVGVQPPSASWGLMLRGTYGYIEQTPTASIFPGLVITLVVLGFNVIGDGLRDFLDPARR